MLIFLSVQYKNISFLNFFSNQGVLDDIRKQQKVEKPNLKTNQEPKKLNS